METHESKNCAALTRPTLLAPVRKHHKSRRLNPTCQPNARQQTQSKPRRHNRPTVQCHGHQRNCRTETCRVFPAPPGVQEPQCPRHHTNMTPLFKQRAAPPMQVNHSVVFTQRTRFGSVDPLKRMIRNRCWLSERFSPRSQFF